MPARAVEGLTGIVPPPTPLADCVGGRSLGAVGPARARRFGGIRTNALPHRLRRRVRALEGLTGIELASSVWKTEALPLSYSPDIRRIVRRDVRFRFYGMTRRCLCRTGPSARLLGADQHASACAPARGVAQLGRAPALGAGGRRFKSCRPDITAPQNPDLQPPRRRARSITRRTNRHGQQHRREAHARLG